MYLELPRHTYLADHGDAPIGRGSLPRRGRTSAPVRTGLEVQYPHPAEQFNPYQEGNWRQQCHDSLQQRSHDSLFYLFIDMRPSESRY